MSFISNLIPSRPRTNGDSEQQSSSAADLPTIQPAYSINETPEAWGLTVHLPGVAKGGVTVTDEDGSIVIRGERAWKKPAAWVSVHRESSDRAFELSLQHDNAIDPEKIVAEQTDGILRVSLPKAQSRKPRQIAVS